MRYRIVWDWYPYTGHRYVVQTRKKWSPFWRNEYDFSTEQQADEYIKMHRNRIVKYYDT